MVRDTDSSDRATMASPLSKLSLSTILLLCALDLSPQKDSYNLSHLQTLPFMLFPVTEPWLTPEGSALPLKAAHPTCHQVKGESGAPHYSVLQQIMTLQLPCETTALSGSCHPCREAVSLPYHLWLFRSLPLWNTYVLASMSSSLPYIFPSCWVTATIPSLASHFRGLIIFNSIFMLRKVPFPRTTHHENQIQTSHCQTTPAIPFSYTQSLCLFLG